MQTSAVALGLTCALVGATGCIAEPPPKAPVQAGRAVIVVAPPVVVPSRCDDVDGTSTTPRAPGAFVAWRAGEGDRRSACVEVCASQVRPGEALVDCDVASARSGVTFGCEGAACGASWQRDLASGRRAYCDPEGGPAAQPRPFTFTPHDTLVVCQLSR